MRQFEYVQPETLAELVKLAEHTDARLLGGGTNLVDLMKLGVERPTLLIDVRGVLEDGVSARGDGGVHIGAGTTNGEIAASRLIREQYPAVVQAVLAGASGPLRNLATAGGDLLQRTRCPYFQDLTKPCNKREPGAGCSAQGGDSRLLGILGTSDTCAATHPSDFAVGLAAFDAEVWVSGPIGDRVLPITDLYRLPEDDATRETVLEAGDVITAIELPPAINVTGSRYRKVRDRAAFAFALVSVAAVTTADEVRIALGGVAPRPWRALAAEKMLRGQTVTEELLRAAMDRELDVARPLDGNAFKVTLARELMVDTVLELIR